VAPIPHAKGDTLIHKAHEVEKRKGSQQGEKCGLNEKHPCIQGRIDHVTVLDAELDLKHSDTEEETCQEGVFRFPAGKNHLGGRHEQGQSASKGHQNEKDQFNTRKNSVHAIANR